MKKFLLLYGCALAMVATSRTAEAQRHGVFSFFPADVVQVDSLDSGGEQWIPSAGTVTNSQTEISEGFGSLEHFAVGGEGPCFQCPFAALNFAQPQDWTDRLLLIDLKIENLETLLNDGVAIIVSNDATTDPAGPDTFTVWQIPKSELVEGRWQTLTIDLAAFPTLIIGAFLDPSQIRWIGLQRFVKLRVGGTLWWDNLRVVPRDRAVRFRALGSVGGIVGGVVATSSAIGISPDGTTVVGTSLGDAFRWTEEGGNVGLGTDGQAWDVTDGGAMITGLMQEGPTQAFRWRADRLEEGARPLGPIADGLGEVASLGFALSADGNVLVGAASATDPTSGGNGFEAFWWTAGPDGLTGTLDDRGVGLGDLPLGDFQSLAFDVSADGSIVVGRANTAVCDAARTGGRIRNASFAKDFEYWTVSTLFGSATVDLIRVLDRKMAELNASGLGVAMLSQNITTPAGCFRLDFDHQFTTPTGRLDVFLEGVQIGSVLPPADPATDLGPARILVENESLFGLADATLQFRLHATGPDPATIRIDDIGFKSGLALNEREAFRWDPGDDGIPGTPDDRLLGLGDLEGGDRSSEALAISDDGNVIVGIGRSESGAEAFRWTATEGMKGIGDLCGGNFLSNAQDVTADGSIMVGFSSAELGNEAFVWDQATAALVAGEQVCPDPETGKLRPATGLRSLRRTLIDDFGLDINRWVLSAANAISADGQRVAGAGNNPRGAGEGWAVILPEGRSFFDADGDGTPNVRDVCTAVPDDQSDADQDGVGDACECGDVDGDGVLGPGDVSALEQCLATPGSAPDCGGLLCDVTGEGRCDATDLAALRGIVDGTVRADFVSCPQRPHRCGDVNEDGEANTTDVRMIQLCATGQVNCDTLGFCDLNGDGFCNTSDGRLLQRLIVGQIPREMFPCVPLAP